MRNKVAIIMAFLVLFMGVESKALMFGIRFSDLTEQTLPVSDAGTKGRFGIYIGQQQKNNVFLIGADYDRSKTQRGDSLLYARRLTVSIGYRYQLFPADKETATKVAPFIALQYFKSFAQVTGDSGMMLPSGVVSSPKLITYMKDLANDGGIIASAGAEYYFTPTFSFGAEGGIRYSKASSGALGYPVKISEYHSFVALLLSVYLQ